MAVRPTIASALLHAALLLLAMRVALPSTTLPDLIPVSLISGGRGGGGGGEAPAAPAPAPAAAAAPAAQPAMAPAAAAEKVAVRREVAPPRPVKPLVAAAPKPSRKSDVPPIAAPPSAAPPAADAAPAPAVASLPTDAGAPGAGNGEGTGSGSGPGAGSGSGGGSGSGVGRDTGAGGGPDLRAFCLDCPEPRYPRQAVMRGWQGKVWIELALGPDGDVASVAVARSSGFPLLDDAAVQVARQSRFRVADRRSGVLAYTFRLTASR